MIEVSLLMASPETVLLSTSNLDFGYCAPIMTIEHLDLPEVTKERQQELLYAEYGSHVSNMCKCRMQNELPTDLK
jgi:hypothetical protein